MTRLPPGPRVPAAWQTLRWLTSPLDFLSSAAKEHGDTFTLSIAPFDRVVVVTRPEDVREVFAASPDDVLGGRANVVVRNLFGPSSVLLLDGAPHARQRKLLMPPFHGERMNAFGATVLEEALSAIERMPANESFSLLRPLLDLTLKVILRTVFGVSAGRLARLEKLLSEALELLLSPALLVPALQRDLGPFSPWGRYLRVGREVEAELRAEIASRRREPDESRADILSLLLSARDEAGLPMTDDEIRDELFTLLAAGHETTAAALAWAVSWVSRKPDVEARLLAEIEESGLSPERIQKLPFLDAVVRESLRLEPLLPLVGRVLERDLRFAGYDLPAGVVVAPCITLAHRRAETYALPDDFRPERFLEKKPGPGEWFPFGGGARRCIGAAFAMAEMKWVLAALVSRRRVRLAAPGKVRAVRRGITLTPERGLVVTASRR